MTTTIVMVTASMTMNRSQLTRGWRQSMRNESWYRRRNGWTAVVVAADKGYRIVLKRTVWTFEDALADANGVLR